MGLEFFHPERYILELGGFHPDCIPKHLQRFQGDGETGLSYKIKEKGYKSIYHPGAMVYHLIPASRLTVEYFEARFLSGGMRMRLRDTANRAHQIEFKTRFMTRSILEFTDKAIRPSPNIPADP